MEDYKKLYFTLFNRVSEAVEAIEEQNFGKAKELLEIGQLEAEEAYIESGELSLDVNS